MTDYQLKELELKAAGCVFYHRERYGDWIVGVPDEKNEFPPWSPYPFGYGNTREEAVINAHTKMVTEKLW